MARRARPSTAGSRLAATSSQTSARSGVVLGSIGLVALVVAAFWPAFSAEFVSWDDEILITANHSFRGLSLAHLRWMFTTNWMGPYQPLGWLSLAIDHHLWGLGGPTEFPEAPYYHATNVALHALTALVFFACARRLFAAAFPEQTTVHPIRVTLAAFFASAVFAIHPLRVESVAWVAERRDVLCGLFYVASAFAWLRWAPRADAARIRGGAALAAIGCAALALALFFVTLDFAGRETLALKGPGGLGLVAAFAALAVSAACVLRAVDYGAALPRAAWYSASLALFSCALLSKGLAMALPVLFVLVDVWPLGRARVRFTLERASVGRDPLRIPALAVLALEKLPFFVLALLCARFAVWGQAANYGTVVSWERHTLSERALQAAFGLVFYPLKTLWPSALSPIYPLPDDLRITDPRFAASLVAVIVVTLACIAFLRKRPAYAFAWAAFAIAVAPVLGFAQAGPQIAADRYSYFSCMPFALLAGAALLRWSASALPWLALACVTALTFATHRQTAIWRESSTLWAHAIAIDPNGTIANLNLGHALVQRSQRESTRERREALLHEALAIFDRGVRVERHPLLVAGVALVHQQLWEIDPPRRADEAELALASAREALDIARARDELTPEYTLNLGSAQFNAGHVDEAIAELTAFVAARPDNFWGRFGLGFALVRVRRFDDALPHLARATQLEPSFVNAWGNLGFAAESQGKRELAITAYEHVLALAPNHPTATVRLRELRGR